MSDPTEAPASTAPPSTGTPPRDVSSLPPEALALAARLFDAARRGDDELLGAALGGGLKPNMTNEKGDTLLMLAAYHGHLSTVTLLLGRGADPDVLNMRGQSPLAGTVFKHELEIARALVAAGADPDAGNPSAREAVRLFGLGDAWEDLLPRAAGAA